MGIRHHHLVLAFCAAFAGSSAWAQEDFSPTLSLSSAKGESSHQYEIEDFSVSTYGGTDYDTGEPTVEISLSISSIEPVDEFLLNWTKQSANQAGRKVSVQVAPEPEVPSAPFRYDFEGAKVTGFSASHSSSAGMGGGYVTLQVTAKSLAINGLDLN